MPPARREHTAQSRKWRRRIAAVVFDEQQRALVLAAVAIVGDVAEAAKRCGVTLAQVYGRASWDRPFRDELEHALAAACSAGEHCGTVRG